MACQYMKIPVDLNLTPLEEFRPRTPPPPRIPRSALGPPPSKNPGSATDYAKNFSLLLTPLTLVSGSFSDADLSVVRGWCYRPVSGVSRLVSVWRPSTFFYSNRFFIYSFQWILLKLGTIILWVSLYILFFSEF